MSSFQLFHRLLSLKLDIVNGIIIKWTGQIKIQDPFDSVSPICQQFLHKANEIEIKQRKRNRGKANRTRHRQNDGTVGTKPLTFSPSLSWPLPFSGSRPWQIIANFSDMSERVFWEQTHSKILVSMKWKICFVSYALLGQFCCIFFSKDHAHSHWWVSSNCFTKFSH